MVTNMSLEKVLVLKKTLSRNTIQKVYKIMLLFFYSALLCKYSNGHLDI